MMDLATYTIERKARLERMGTVQAQPVARMPRSSGPSTTVTPGEAAAVLAEVSRAKAITRLLKQVTRKYHTTRAELRDKYRHRYLVAARYEAMWRLSTELGLSLEHIGRITNRNHSTVFYGITVHQDRIEAGR